MRNRAVHDALRLLAREVAAFMAGELEAGAELPFDVVEEGQAWAPLYRYRPFTGQFIDERWERVTRFDSYVHAVRALGDGARPYLRHRGLADGGADLALRDLMHRLFEDAPGFSLSDDRFDRVHAELDSTLAEPLARATVLAPVHGVRIASARVQLSDDLALVRRSTVASPPTALEGAARAREGTTETDSGDLPDDERSPLDVFCVLERDLPPEALLPVDTARTSFRRTLTALRLCGAGGTALGPLAWARVDNGAWHPVGLGVSARSRPESWELRPGEEAEVRGLMAVLGRSRHGPTVGWALARFQMGCERDLEVEALTDYLLALRALLGEPAGGDDDALAGRVAALCAAEPDRGALGERIGLAVHLERRLVHGAVAEAGALDSPRALVREVEQSLRAILRDLVCGYLDEDVSAAADGRNFSAEELDWGEAVADELPGVDEMLEAEVA